MGNKPRGPLRRGWTTGACAAAAAKAAYAALLTGEFPDPVEILLPKGDRPSFALARQSLAPGEASADAIADQTRRLLPQHGQAHHRDAARAIAAEIARMPAPDEVARRLPEYAGLG